MVTFFHPCITDSAWNLDLGAGATIAGKVSPSGRRADALWLEFMIANAKRVVRTTEESRSCVNSVSRQKGASRWCKWLVFGAKSFCHIHLLNNARD